MTDYIDQAFYDELDLNWVAKEAINALRERGLDEPYLRDKARGLSKHNSKYDTLLWANGVLDIEVTKIFARRIGLTVSEIEQFAQIAQKI